MPKRKPSKPDDDFPLYGYSKWQWAKRIQGKIHDFRPWSDWRQAIDQYLEDRDDLQAGRTPRWRRHDVLTVSDDLNRVLEATGRLIEPGGVTSRKWDGYLQACRFAVQIFGRGLNVENLVAGHFDRLRVAIVVKRSQT